MDKNPLISYFEASGTAFSDEQRLKITTMYNEIVNTINSSEDHKYKLIELTLKTRPEVLVIRTKIAETGVEMTPEEIFQYIDLIKIVINNTED